MRAHPKSSETHENAGLRETWLNWIEQHPEPKFTINLQFSASNARKCPSTNSVGIFFVSNLLPFLSTRLPFSVQNLFVYFVAFVWEYGTWYFIVATYFCTIGFLIALCRLLSMFLKDLNADWQKLHKIKKIGESWRFQMKFHDIICAHSQVKQLSEIY